MTSPGPTPSTSERVATVAAVVLAVGVLVQGYLASRHLAVGASIDVHGIVGDTLLLVAIVMPAVSLLRGHDGVRFGLGVACAALVFAQIGMGYVGRESAEARAWHIANGVLVAVLAGAQALLWLRSATPGPGVEPVPVAGAVPEPAKPATVERS